MLYICHEQYSKRCMFIIYLSPQVKMCISTKLVKSMDYKNDS